MKVRIGNPRKPLNQWFTNERLELESAQAFERLRKHFKYSEQASPEEVVDYIIAGFEQLKQKCNGEFEDFRFHMERLRKIMGLEKSHVPTLRDADVLWHVYTAIEASLKKGST